MGCYDLHQEPRPAAGGRGGRAVSRRGAVPNQGQSLVVERSFLGRRHFVGNLREPQKLSPERRLGQSARARDAPASRIFTANGEPTTRTPRPPIPTPVFLARGRARRRGRVL